MVSWPAWSLDLSPIDKILSWVSERLAGLPSLANIYEEWHKLEAAWNELHISVIQAQFDFMLSRVRAILAARVATVFTKFALLNPETTYKFNPFVFMPFCLRRINIFFF